MRYTKTTAAGKTLYQHRIEAEAALGHLLPMNAVVHHAGGTLVICQDQAYHMLLHQRMRVLALGGNPDTDRICCKCRQLTPGTAFRKGMCLPCGQQSARESGDRLLDRRKAAGLCIACGKPADGFVRCQPCRALNLAAQRKHYRKLS